ncbi:MAG TPA: hypothetical protein VGL99_13090 [Chloroflexota bacterium]
MRLRGSAPEVILRVALAVAGLVVVGEAGHVVLDLLNLDMAHHLFHIAFPLVGFVIFGAAVARDVCARGWPTFSWRLEPEVTRGSERKD